MTSHTTWPSPKHPVELTTLKTGRSRVGLVGAATRCGGPRRLERTHEQSAGFYRVSSCATDAASLIYNYMVVGLNLADEDVDRLFQALADRTRRDILARAIEHEQSVSALARRYDMSFAAVQKHVAVLERAELVRKERHGREQIIHASGPTISKAIALLAQYERLWIDRANQIAAILASSEEKGNNL